jgi:FixJ family two-component response regulator
MGNQSLGTDLVVAGSARVVYGQTHCPMSMTAICASPPPTVFVVDDDDSFRTAASRLLRATGHPVKAFSSATEFLESLPTVGPGCVVTDLEMPGLSGLELQAALARANNPLPVLFLTGHGDIPTSVKAMRRGAEDFLTKRAPKEDLLEAVKRALARDARQRAERARLEDLRAQLAALSPRELVVLKQVVQGKMNKEIADALGINIRTVKLHRTAITTKLGVHSSAELTKLWLEASGGAGLDRTTDD